MSAGLFKFTEYFATIQSNFLPLHGCSPVGSGDEPSRKQRIFVCFEHKTILC